MSVEDEVQPTKHAPFKPAPHPLKALDGHLSFGALPQLQPMAYRTEPRKLKVLRHGYLSAYYQGFGEESWMRDIVICAGSNRVIAPDCPGVNSRNNSRQRESVLRRDF
jgi:hypothetical protein